MIDCPYRMGRYDDHGVARHGYAADAPFINTPRQTRRHYSKRLDIEATYRLSESSLISTTVNDQTRRLLFVVISLLVQNVWRYLHWEYMATPRQASPLVVALRGVHSHSCPRSVKRFLGSAVDPNESPT